jgi:hypothetical protein
MVGDADFVSEGQVVLALMSLTVEGVLRQPRP